MASDLAARLCVILAGKSPNSTVTTGAPVTGHFGYRSNPLKLLRLPELPVESGALPNMVIHPVAGPVTCEPDLEGDISERTAIAIVMGLVPVIYAGAFARLQCLRLPGIPQDWQERAVNIAGLILDAHGAALVTLAWPAAALFDAPVVVATAGESAALDLRKAGLVWKLREGDTIERLAPDSAIIRGGDGKAWHFKWRSCHEA